MRRENTHKLRDAIVWIARNDESACTDAEAMKDLISVLLIADLFGWKPIEIATLVVRLRAEMATAADPQTWAKIAAKETAAAPAR